MPIFCLLPRCASIAAFAVMIALPGMANALPSMASPLRTTDVASSAITIVFKQMNVAVEAKFKKFSAQVNYDTKQPEAAKAKVEIEINSFDLGDPEYNKEVLKKDWFNAAQFPKATFVSNTIKSLGAGKCSVSGKLTIKGKSLDVRFPLTIKKEGNQQIFEGVLPIKRGTFNIGDGEWKDTSMVADEVVIKFHIVTRP
jgi:polyisoprenoid-binding protein YceI